MSENIHMNDDTVSLEDIKKDLKFQLEFGEMDWDFFVETANNARNIAITNGENFTESLT